MGQTSSHFQHHHHIVGVGIIIGVTSMLLVRSLLHTSSKPISGDRELGEVDTTATATSDDIIPNECIPTSTEPTTTALVNTELGEQDLLTRKQPRAEDALDLSERMESAVTNDLKKYAIVEENLPPALKNSPKRKKKSNPQKGSVSPVKSKLSPLNYAIPDLRAMSPEHPPIQPHNSVSLEDAIVPPSRPRNEKGQDEFKELQRSDSVSSKSSTSSINTLTSISSTTQKATEAWEPNNASNACRVCSVQFGVINRKHHCRKW
jgi:hypothetical protein